MLPLLVLALVVACEGPVGPQGPQGPQGAEGPAGAVGPQGPAGKSVAYQVFEGAITATTMNTPTVNTGGVFPGIVCYVTHTLAPGAWLQLNTDTFNGTACGVVQDGSSGYYGSAVLTTDMVNSGWTLRVILFWLPA